MPNSNPLSYLPLIGQRAESIPPVDALSDDDLERMKFAALQAGDNAKDI